ncbi:hypothetical protein C8Q78DRAFT_847030 [Trametes maxima]|nr:hypothetical protein C8Q78DRAFT_847030 [Trametes maxima]
MRSAVLEGGQITELRRRDWTSAGGRGRCPLNARNHARTDGPGSVQGLRDGQECSGARDRVCVTADIKIIVEFTRCLLLACFATSCDPGRADLVRKRPEESHGQWRGAPEGRCPFPFPRRSPRHRPEGIRVSVHGHAAHAPGIRGTWWSECVPLLMVHVTAVCACVRAQLSVPGRTRRIWHRAPRKVPRMTRELSRYPATPTRRSPRHSPRGVAFT